MENIKNHPLYRIHTIDSAMNDMFSFYKSKFVVLYLFSLIVSLLTVFYTNSLIDMELLQSTTDPEKLMGIFSEMMLPLGILVLFSQIVYVIMGHYIIYSPLDDDWSIWRSVARSFKFLVPYLITMVLFVFAASFAALIGIAALVIGLFFVALYMTVIYLFLLPVFLVEGTNIGNAISRSISIAHKGFWQNMGWVAVTILIYIVVSMVLSAIITIPFAGNILKTFFEAEATTEIVTYTSNPVYLAFSAITSALLIPVFPILGATLYLNARAKEEPKTDKTELFYPID